MRELLDLPERPQKPRDRGLNVVLDSGLSLARYRDCVESLAAHVDYIKFGWGTALVTPVLREKIEIARESGIEPFFGGTLFEKCALQGRLGPFREALRELDIRVVEVSNGTIELDHVAKAKYVAEFAEEFAVFAEVGLKDVQRSLQMHPALWVDCIRRDLEAGAARVITESRESGRSGICRADGEVRFGLIEEILDSGVDVDRLVFEAPNKALQTYFVKRVGPAVNLANLHFDDVIPVETLRLGLRSDTLLDFEPRRP